MTVTQKKNFVLPHDRGEQELHAWRTYSGSNYGSFLFSAPQLCGANLRARSRPSRFNHFTQLPVIEEEDGYCSEDDFDLKNYFYSNDELKELYLNRKTFTLLLTNKFNKISKKKKIDGDKISEPKPPSSLNINCMINTEVKQCHQIWDTNFARKLINGKHLENTNESTGLDADSGENQSETSKSLGLVVRKNCGSFITTDTSEREVSTGVGVEVGVESTGSDKLVKNRKLKKFTNGQERRNVRKRKNNAENVKLNEVPGEEEKKVSTKKENREEKNVHFMGENSLTGFLSTSTSSARNQHYLTECIKNILENHSEKITCELCEKTFTNFTELFDHKKIHEEEKRICVICGKVFGDGHEFNEHLLTHESVDRFSCKKCRKYFPTLKKYEEHKKSFHATAFDVSTIYPDAMKRDRFKTSEFKYECSRCKVGFDSAETHRAHKKSHLNTDLATANLLCPTFANVL